MKPRSCLYSDRLSPTEAPRSCPAEPVCVSLPLASRERCPALYRWMKNSSLAMYSCCRSYSCCCRKTCALLQSTVRRVVAREALKPSMLHLPDLGADAVQEVAVVGNCQHRVLELGQEPFEPVQAVEVQVVGWLVQHQQIRVCQQCASKSGARSFSAACHGCLGIQCLLCQSDSLGDTLHLALVVVATEGLVLLEQLAVPVFCGPASVALALLDVQRRIGKLCLPARTDAANADSTPSRSVPGRVVFSELWYVCQPQTRSLVETVPASGSSSPTNTRSSDVLPLPLDPTSPMRDCSFTSASTPAKTSISP